MNDHCGDKVRTGVAGVKRALNKPTDISITNKESTKTYAGVLDEEAEVYISTNGDGYNVTYWEDEVEKSADFDKIDEAVEFFLEARKE